MKSVVFLVPLLLVGLMPVAFGQVVETKGQNYDLIEDFTIGEAKWTSHPERIMVGGQWENYFLTTDNQKIIFNSNSVGGFIYDIPSCSYSIYENGFDGNQIIPSVSAVATYFKEGTWQNMAVNQEQCTVNVSQNENGIFLTSTKTIFGETNEPLFQSYNGTDSTIFLNGTSYDVINNGNQTGYYVDNFVPFESEKFTQEIKVDVNSGIKETFMVWNDGTEELGISQTVHTGESINVGGQTIDIAQFNGQSFDKQFLEENQAQIFEIANGLNYDFDLGFESLTGLNIFFDGDYKVNLDYADGGFVNYLEIDPTFSSSSQSYSESIREKNNNNVCDETGGTYGNLGGVGAFYMSVYNTGSSYGDCNRSVIEWDITAIPDSATITDVDLDYWAGSSPTSDTPNPIDIYQPSTQPSTRTLAQNFDECNNGSLLVDNTTTFDVNYNYGVLDLGVNADSGLQNLLTSDYFAICLKHDNETQTSVYQVSYIDGNSATLEVTYSLPTAPQPPTNLQTTTGIPIELSWTAPVDNGGSAITGYKVFRTDSEYLYTPLKNHNATQETGATGITTSSNFEGLFHFDEDTASYNLDITSATELNQYDFTSEATNSIDMYMKEDGTRFWISEEADKINEYDMSTPYDTSTASFVASYTHGLTNPKGIYFDESDGLSFYLCVYNTQDCKQYTLGTQWSVGGTVTSDGSMSLGDTAQGVYISPDGKQVIYADNSGNVNRRTLTTAWDINGGNSLSGTTWNKGDIGVVTAVTLTSDGKTMFVGGFAEGGKVFAYSLPTAFNLGSSTLLGHFTMPDSETSIQGLKVVNNDRYLAVQGQSNDFVWLFDISNVNAFYDYSGDDNHGTVFTPSTVFSDDFSSDTWSTTGSDVAVSSNKMVITTLSTVDTDNKRTALGQSLSDNFSIDYDFKVTGSNFPAGCCVNVGAVSLTNGATNSYHDDDGFVMDVRIQSGNTLDFVGRSFNGGSPDTATSDINISSGTQYYVTLEKSGTTGTLKVYSDSARTTHISGSPQTWTIDSGVTGLTHIQIGDGSYDGSGAGYNYSAEVDNISVTKNSPTSPQISTSSIDTNYSNEIQFNYGGMNVTSSSYPSGTNAWSINGIVTLDQTDPFTFMSFDSGTEVKITMDDEYIELTKGGTAIFNHTLSTPLTSTTSNSDYENDFTVCTDTECTNEATQWDSGRVADAFVDTTNNYLYLDTKAGDYDFDAISYDLHQDLTDVSDTWVLRAHNYNPIEEGTGDTCGATFAWIGLGSDDADVSRDSSTHDFVGVVDWISNYGIYNVDWQNSPYQGSLYGDGVLAYSVVEGTDYNIEIIATSPTTYDVYVYASGDWDTPLGSQTGLTKTNDDYRYISYSGTFVSSGVCSVTSQHSIDKIEFFNGVTSSEQLVNPPQAITIKKSTSGEYETFVNGTRSPNTSTTDTTTLGTPTNNLYHFGMDTSLANTGTWRLDELSVRSDEQTDQDSADFGNRILIQSLATTGTTPEYDDSSAVGGNTYYYYTKAVNAIGDSDYSAKASGLAGTPPDAPTGLTATIQDPNANPLDIFLQWSSPTNVGSGTLSGFEVWRDGSLVTTTGLVTSYTDTVGGAGTYSYEVKAVSTHGTSGSSNSASATTPNPPDAPTVTLAINNPNSNPLDITVTPVAPANNGGSAITGYNLYSSSDDVTYNLEASNVNTSQTVTVSSAGTWYFKAEAINPVGTSPLSTASSIATPSVPDAPTSLNAIINDPDNNPNNVTLTWASGASNGGSAITGYKVYITPNAGTQTLLTTTNAGTLTYNDASTKSANTQHTYEVKAINNVGESLGATTNITTLNVPSSPTISILNGTTVASWTVPNSDSNITNYKLYRDGSLVATLTDDTTSHKDTTSIVFGNSYGYQVTAVSLVGESALSNTVNTTPITDVDDLQAVSTTGVSTILDWTEPEYYQGSVTSYSVYYSTPYSSSPSTLIGTTANSYLNLYGQLQYSTNYAFMVTVNSVLGNSVTSNIANVTTTEDTSIVTYDPTTGSDWFDIDAQNPESINLTKFTRNDIGTNSTVLTITYPSYYEDLTCDLDYKFGQETLQYSDGDNMQSTLIDADNRAVQLQFNNLSSEVIAIQCADQGVTDSSSSYTLTLNQANVPLFQQISNFRSGDYGTNGYFGALDLIGVFVVIIAMVGFNRTTPIAGVIIGISALLGLAYFGIIQIPATIFGILALLGFLAWGVTKR